MYSNAFAATVCLWLLCCVAGMSCSRQDETANTPKQATENVVLRVAVSDPLCGACACDCVGDSAQRSYEGLAQVLQESGAKLQFTYFEDETDMLNQVAAGGFDVMICKAWLGIMTPQVSQQFERVVDVAMPADSPRGLWGEFVVLQDSPVKTLADVKGARVVMGPKTSYEKCHAGFQRLRDEGLSETDFTVLEAYSCKSAAVELLDGRADVALISHYAAQYGCLTVVADPGEFRVVDRTKGEIPFISVFFSTELPEKQRVVWRDVLLSLQGDRTPGDLMSRGIYPITAWSPKESE